MGLNFHKKWQIGERNSFSTKKRRAPHAFLSTIQSYPTVP